LERSKLDNQKEQEGNYHHENDLNERNLLFYTKGRETMEDKEEFIN
jgi:hypothetical protein